MVLGDDRKGRRAYEQSALVGGGQPGAIGHLMHSSHFSHFSHSLHAGQTGHSFSFGGRAHVASPSSAFAAMACPSFKNQSH